MTMSAVTSLSLDPPQFLVCMDKRAKTLAALTESRAFCIQYLSEAQQHLSSHFARPGGDRFAGVAYRQGQTGAPVLEDTLAFVECELDGILPGGDHAIVIGNAICGDVHGGHPLGYFHGAYHKIS
jgi:flavin reductase (DIM6/NTAB) family NADH-FMN oxidoreductase RutF